MIILSSVLSTIIQVCVVCKLHNMLRNDFMNCLYCDITHVLNRDIGEAIQVQLHFEVQYIGMWLPW